MARETSAVALRHREQTRVTVPVSRGSLLSGVELKTCPLCGQAEADDRILIMLRWGTQGTAHDAQYQDAEQMVNVRVPVCGDCRLAQETDARPRLRRFLDVVAAISLGCGLLLWGWVEGEGLYWQWNAAAIGFGVLLPVVSRWILRKTGKGRALEVARVKGNRVELEAPETFRQVLAAEYPAALNVD